MTYVMSPPWAEMQRWRKLPYEWGIHDCALVCADWVHRWHGVDPADGVRLTYEDRSSCERVTRFLTEPLGITTRCFEGVAHLTRTEMPASGDIGVVMLRGQPFANVGMRLSKGHWGFLSENKGAYVVKDRMVAQVLRAWVVQWDGHDAAA